MGELAKRAREFNRLIGPAAEAATVARITPGPPVVDIAMAECERIQWEAFDDLDQNEGDDRVVAQIVHARDVPPDRRLLFSHDNNPIAIAARHKIKSRKMPDHWLLEPEPNPHEKELQKLRSRNQELEAQEPNIDVALAFGITAPVQLYEIRPLSDHQQLQLVHRILYINPEMSQSPFGPSDFSYGAEHLEPLTLTAGPRYGPWCA